MNIAILGFDREGRSSYEYWNDGTNTITICDQNNQVELPSGSVSQLGENYLKNLSSFNLLIRTPGIHPSAILEDNPGSPDILDKVFSNTNEFLKVCPTKNMIGVTGTKGKGTTSTLIAKMLEAAGKRVHLGGNIGIPPLELLKENIDTDDWVVLELSNFQLFDLKRSPHIAVCLMVVPEHQDWHPTVDEYYQAKSQLFRWQSEEDIAVYFKQNSNTRAIVEPNPGTKIPYFEKPGAVVNDHVLQIDDVTICPTSDLKLLGEHNWQNACAAITTVWQTTQDVGAIRSVLTSFTGLEHRLEKVRELGGVTFYDDSFGTTPETAIVAIKAFTDPKVVILGGSDKGSSYSDLAATVISSDVRAVITIGEMGAVIEQELRSQGYTNIYPGGTTMTDIVSKARAYTQPGDVVLLSTGCASFGLFKNYKDRGNQFKQVVNSL